MDTEVTPTTHTSRTSRATRVTVLVEERYRAQLQPAGLVEALRAVGAQVSVVGDAALDDWHGGDSEVVVARGRSVSILEALRRAEERGIPTIDPSASIAGVRDKAGMSRLFADAGMPVPRTWAGTGPQVCRDILSDPWPDRPEQLIVKPVFGDNGEGIHLLDSPAQLDALGGDWVVQEFIPGPGVDLKLYAIGEQVWAAHKASPVTPCRDQTLGPVEVTARLRELALECGRLFDLSIFGVDCLEVDGDLIVIEVNDFPNFTTVPGAGDRLAEHVLTG